MESETPFSSQTGEKLLGEKVQIDLDEVLLVFALMEDLVSFMHQPCNYSAEKLEEFAVERGGYQRISEAYYNVIWNWLPIDIKQDIEER